MPGRSLTYVGVSTPHIAANVPAGPPVTGFPDCASGTHTL